MIRYQLFYILTAIFIPCNCYSAVLFQDNFNLSPDWQSNQTVKKPIGLDIIAYDYSTGEYSPPAGWSGYRTAASQWADDRRLDTFVLDSAAARGGSGKGIAYNVEYYADDTGSGGWRGGSLNVWLGEQGYTRLFVSMWVKYTATWEWSDATETRNDWQKFLAVSTYPDYTTGSPMTRGAAYQNMPMIFFDMWIPGTNVWGYDPNFQYATRTSPDYGIPGNASDGTSSGYKHLTNDNNWHFFEFELMMNSGEDIADGYYRVWIDSTDATSPDDENTGLVFKKSGSPTNAWNWVWILDNVNINMYFASENKEGTLYMDDVVISDEFRQMDYVVPDGIPGGGGGKQYRSVGNFNFSGGSIR